MTAQENCTVVRAMFDAYVAQDRAAAEKLLAADLSFTSPQDDHLDRATYFETCFPTAEGLRLQEILHLAALDDDHVAVAYQYEATTGGVHRNSEIHTVRDGRIEEIQVFFGGRVRRA